MDPIDLRDLASLMEFILLCSPLRCRLGGVIYRAGISDRLDPRGRQAHRSADKGHLLFQALYQG